MADAQVLQSGEQGAATGSAAGPWGAAAGGAAGIISGLIGSGQGEKTIDMAALWNTIQNAGQYQRQIINSLPPEIQANLDTYAKSQGTSLATLTGQVQGQAADYQKQMGQIYGPNSAAAVTQKAANTQNIYSQVPGTQNAIRNAMAATGGLQRGNAGVALAQPYVAAAQQTGQANAQVNAQQTGAAQGAAVQALNVVNSMEANLFQTQFGMSQAQAQQILTTGNDALKQQLSQLILQSQNETNQALSVQGISAQNGYQNAIQQQANQGAVFNGLANGVVNGVMAYGATPSATSGAISSYPGMDVSSANYFQNMNANAPAGY
jgi:hypothetical protein